MIWGAQELWEAGDLEGGRVLASIQRPAREQRLLLWEGPGVWGNQSHRILCV